MSKRGLYKAAFVAIQRGSTFTPCSRTELRAQEDAVAKLMALLEKNLKGKTVKAKRAGWIEHVVKKARVQDLERKVAAIMSKLGWREVDRFDPVDPDEAPDVVLVEFDGKDVPTFYLQYTTTDKKTATDVSVGGPGKV